MWIALLKTSVFASLVAFPAALLFMALADVLFFHGNKLDSGKLKKHSCFDTDKQSWSLQAPVFNFDSPLEKLYSFFEVSQLSH